MSFSLWSDWSMSTKFQSVEYVSIFLSTVSLSKLAGNGLEICGGWDFPHKYWRGELNLMQPQNCLRKTKLHLLQMC